MFQWSRLSDASPQDGRRFVERQLGSVPPRHIHMKLYLRCPILSRFGESWFVLACSVSGSCPVQVCIRLVF